jgi:hypothetical protein
MTRIRYTVVIGALAVAMLINLAAIYLHTSAQAAVNRAGLVVQYKDGRVDTRCVTFPESEISGYDLMRRANMQLIADAGGGGTICKIGDTGCNFPAQQCFCDCQDLNQTCVYWIYYFQAGNAWKYASLGPFTQKVTNGSVNGWVYGLGSASSGAVMPPMVSLDAICKSTAAPIVPAIVASAPTRIVTATSTPTIMASTVTPSSVATLATTTLATTATPVPPVATPPTPSATPQPAIAAVSTSQPTPTATPISPTLTPTPMTAPPEGTNNGSYAVFAAIAIVLVVGLVIAQRSIGRNRP